MKILLGIVIGYVLHFTAIEVGNLSSQYRWQQCILKMHSGEVPKALPSGQHYYLGTVFSKDMPLYEKVLLYQLNLYETMNKSFLNSL